MNAYSMDLCQRVLADVDAGMSMSVVAATFSVSPAWVRRLQQRRAATGEIAPGRAAPAASPIGSRTPTSSATPCCNTPKPPSTSTAAGSPSPYPAPPSPAPWSTSG